MCAVTAQRWGGTRRGKGMREDGVGGRKERHRVGDAMGREKRGGGGDRRDMRELPVQLH